ncbi:unnamed protein product [Cylindrotheca closterium]|uniref:Uncharacterized protein n=1 Tax=Cylindrotheca closterium TaxID=2856 RepID=A0AAD2JH80_9STRA|nr:unnamed protein product [Cylindrotheca closterium]
MIGRIVRLVGLSSLLAVPAAAQFGLGKKKGGSFQEMNEQAKQMDSPTPGGADAGGLAGLESLLGDIDPSQLEQLAGIGEYFNEVMELMGDMSPEELEKQMKDAMEMLTGGDMMKGMMGMQDEIIKTMEESGQVSAEELAKYKADPEYFEQKMKESFGQMQELFNDPDTLKAATEGIKGMTDLYKNPEKLGEMFQTLMGDFDNDEKIEEVRQQLLANPDLGIPGLSEAFETPEMKEMLSDPQKWREAVKEGKGMFGAGAAGAGVGEL